MGVIGVPVLNRPDLLRRFLESVDEPWPVVVIDNSDDEDVAMVCDLRGIRRIDAPHNLGVAASWNLVIKAYPAEDWWCIANADTVLGRGDLARIAAEMERPGPAWVGMNGDWRVFGINRECVSVAGWFDENFAPCYCEDADYEYRCTLAGVPWYTVPGGAMHDGSAAIRSDARYGAGNARTYPLNRAYYEAKWGGPLRGGETYRTPFNRGGSVRDWTLDIDRIRGQAW